MPWHTTSTIRCSGMQPVAYLALVALTCMALASCGGGPGAAHPDLVVEDPALSDGGPTAGASFTFSATVRNAGRGNAAVTMLRVYRSDDATITTSDQEVDTATVAELAASESRGASVTVMAPPSPGTYYYGACVEPVAGESDTANNCSAAVRVIVPAQDTQPPPPRPDLVVESPRVSDDGPAAGASFTFSATVRNDGDGTAAATTLIVYRSDDMTITTSGERVGTATVAELLPAGTRVTEVELSAPSSSGTYYYGACVDAVAKESVAANNCSPPVPVTVQGPLSGPPGPDLVVERVWVSSDSPALGGVFRLGWVLYNPGGDTEDFLLRCYRSDDATFTPSDSQVREVREPGLHSRSRRITSVHVDTPSTKGTHYYRVCADAVRGESDTTNNCSTAVKIEVSHANPNLQFHSVGVGSWVESSFPLVAEVQNVGGPSAATTLRFYRSTDRTITTADEEVGETSVPALVKNKPHTPRRFLSRQVYVPGPSTPGVHHYGACVDAVPGESDTTDNCSWIAHTIWR